MMTSIENDCPHEVVIIRASIDQETMTLYSISATCTTCEAVAEALDDEVVLGPWKEHR